MKKTYYELEVWEKGRWQKARDRDGEIHCETLEEVVREREYLLRLYDKVCVWQVSVERTLVDMPEIVTVK